MYTPTSRARRVRRGQAFHQTEDGRRNGAVCAQGRDEPHSGDASLSSVHSANHPAAPAASTLQMHGLQHLAARRIDAATRG